MDQSIHLAAMRMWTNENNSRAFSFPMHNMVNAQIWNAAVL
ncbi:hypothetical protein FOMG_19773 [Fusarium oxysporum f. sp. melonis 26406]|uniref:Uncharacterized protein n=1 Tax=Fusarium oxysporum f. sp. melonis 26406 TaxID=1089452 RepID=W9Z5A7_FUSOX|nr:hypothetical protein FOMG_19773 [Fusarium oxysporum f. sp. melonis 26406]